MPRDVKHATFHCKTGQLASLPFCLWFFYLMSLMSSLFSEARNKEVKIKTRGNLIVKPVVTTIHSLMVLEVKDQKSSSQQDCVPSEGFGENPSLTLPACGGFWKFQCTLASDRVPPICPPPSHMAFFSACLLCACMLSPLV